MIEKSNERILEVKELSVSYKTLHVLFDVSLEIQTGEVVVVVGRNGAGKTTLFRTVAGFLKQDSGTILFKGEDIGHLPSYEVALKGLKYIQQDKHVFADLTVRENLELGSYATKDYDWDRVLEHFPKLKTLMDRKGGNLSGGERQMLLMAQSLLGKPELVLMDEPTEGLAPHVIEDLKGAFKKISEQSTLVIIEQNLPLTAEVAHRVYAMKEGKIVAEVADKKEIQDLAFEKYL
ncbi:MAG: ABC transporter ATP-binding protein [Deltaproteobacteria bacterium]|nr:ABC transporter ATP-binding protein [Deltaproteobacteria bacterium]MBW1919156.1 ABC transporter ATP-binding protein [Deltaproteobacteria bacterium]MBW1934191.1 ABC transporter ATP-binding protein [Deltaproteobacteria bacterium]MBW1976450.1 ABC transporter ATP-binding protein [Deltaproteobacteria bacterium]MBW2043685.1 ABC transporter ATP-binding protein [Deltaproteobacteria bacterium]